MLRRFLAALCVVPAIAFVGPRSLRVAPRRCPSPRCADDGSCRLHGLSVSDAGLVAILTDGRGQMLPVLVTEEDRQTAHSPAALCLMQLLQGIDLGGTTFPPERLLQLSEDPTGEDRVEQFWQVQIESASDLKLCFATPQGEPTRTVGVPPWDALALALRYETPLNAAAGLFEAEAAFAELLLPARYPSCYTMADAAEQRLVHGELTV